MCEVTVVGKKQCSGGALFHTNNAAVGSHYYNSRLTRYCVKTSQKGGPITVGTKAKAFHISSSIKSSQVKWTRQTPGAEIVRQFHDAVFLWEWSQEDTGKTERKVKERKAQEEGKEQKSILLCKYEVKVR